MAVLSWDQTGQRFYETGVDRAVLYIPDAGGVYTNGVAWNGITAITESPGGAETNPMFADNIKYLNLFSLEEYAMTLEAYTFPDQFAQFDGTWIASQGVYVGQQNRTPFGLSYRTRLGNDLLSDDFGYKLHLVYNCLASPSERAYSTVNDSPEAITFSWEIATTPVPVTGRKATSIITIDTTKVMPANLTALTNALWGTGGTDPRLPFPDEVIAMFAGSLTTVTTTAPTFVSTTGVITIPTITGVRYRRADTGATVTGTVTISGGAGAYLTITAEPTNGTYIFSAQSDDDWTFVRTA
jgi:hypothetical protein